MSVNVASAAAFRSTPLLPQASYVAATPIRRVLQAEEIGWLAAFLASPRSGSITGESLGCDGGLSRGIFL